MERYANPVLAAKANPSPKTQDSWLRLPRRVGQPLLPAIHRREDEVKMFAQNGPSRPKERRRPHESLQRPSSFLSSFHRYSSCHNIGAAICISFATWAKTSCEASKDQTHRRDSLQIYMPIVRRRQRPHFTPAKGVIIDSLRRRSGSRPRKQGRLSGLGPSINLSVCMSINPSFSDHTIEGNNQASLLHRRLDLL